MRLNLIYIFVFLIIGCSTPKSYYIKHQYFQTQILLKENKFKLYNNDWHHHFENLETGTWTFYDDVFVFQYYYLKPFGDTANESIEWIETDSVISTELYWLSNRKLFPLTKGSSNLQEVENFSADSSVFTPNSKIVNGINYQFSPNYFYKVGKIKNIIRKIESFKSKKKNITR
jgi:hypothetical protein